MDLNGMVLEADEIPEIMSMQGTGMGCLADRASKPQGIDRGDGIVQNGKVGAIDTIKVVKKLKVSYHK